MIMGMARRGEDWARTVTRLCVPLSRDAKEFGSLPVGCNYGWCMIRRFRRLFW